VRSLVIVGTRGSELETFQTNKITEENIKLFFNHEYEPGKFGSKGMVYEDEKGRVTHMIWAPDGAANDKIQHVDALSHFVGKDIAAIQSEIDVNKMIADFHKERGKEAIKNKEFDSVARHYLIKNQLEMLNADLEIEIAVRKGAVNRLRTARRDDKHNTDLINRVQGFEMTAERDKDGNLKVTVFGVSSMISRIQGNLWRLGRALTDRDCEKYAHMIVRMHESIDPSVRAYDNVVDMDAELYYILKSNPKFLKILADHQLKLR
jgi:hypothetical protein